MSSFVSNSSQVTAGGVGHDGLVSKLQRILINTVTTNRTEYETMGALRATK